MVTKSLAIALFITATALAQAADNHAAADSAKAQKETKRVCVDQTKDGKPVKDAKGVVKQTCKEVKQHKKLEVTK
jgi:hypothetical protein